MLGFIIISWLGPKDTEPRATSVPKAKLGHTEPRALSGYLTPSNGYIGFPYYPLVRLIGPSVSACDHRPQKILGAANVDLGLVSSLCTQVNISPPEFLSGLSTSHEQIIP